MTTNPTRRGARRAASVLAAALIATTGALAAPQPALADEPPPRPVLVCEPGLCVLDPAGTDSDGDGWSDADETSAGYDPADPDSHPVVLQMIDLWLGGGLRPEGPGLREVVVLPETAPDGSSLDRPITSGPAPQRKDAMTRLGLTDGRISGLDTSNGLRAVLDLAGASSKGGRVPVIVGGVDVSTIGTIFEFDRGFADGSAVAVWDRGGRSGSMQLDPPTIGRDGSVAVTLAVTETTRGKDGSTTTTESTTVGSSTPGGASSSVTMSTTTTKNAKGEVTSTSTSTTETRVDPKGNKTVTVKTTTETKEGEATVTTESTTETTTDAKGKVTSKKCTPEPCAGMSSGELDPAPGYVPGQLVAATPELTRYLELRLGGGSTTKGGTPVLSPDSTPSWPLYSRLNPGTVHVDPSNDLVWAVDLPPVPDYDAVGGNVTFVPGVNHPDTTCVPSTAAPCPAR